MQHVGTLARDRIQHVAITGKSRIALQIAHARFDRPVLRQLLTRLRLYGVGKPRLTGVGQRLTAGVGVGEGLGGRGDVHFGIESSGHQAQPRPELPNA